MSKTKSSTKTAAKKSTKKTDSKTVDVTKDFNATAVAAVVSAVDGDGKVIATVPAEKAKKTGLRNIKDMKVDGKSIIHTDEPKKTKAPKAAKEKTVTLASFMRGLIEAGKNNDEVFAAAVKEFGIGDEKKHYPSWYRSEMKRKSNAARAEAKSAATGEASKEKTDAKPAKEKGAKSGAPRTLTIVSTNKF